MNDSLGVGIEYFAWSNYDPLVQKSNISAIWIMFWLLSNGLLMSFLLITLHYIISFRDYDWILEVYNASVYPCSIVIIVGEQLDYSLLETELTDHLKFYLLNILHYSLLITIHVYWSINTAVLLYKYNMHSNVLLSTLHFQIYCFKYFIILIECKS